MTLLSSRHRHRINFLRKEIEKANIECFVSLHPPSVRYLTGFSGSNGLCLMTSKEVILVSDFRYRLQIRKEATYDRALTVQGSLVKASAMKRLLKRGQRIGFEADHLSFSMYEELRSAYPQSLFVPTSGMIEQLASAKDKVEIEMIKKAASITDAVFTDLLGILRPGIRESDVAAEISYLHRKHGAEKDSFDPIVASGPRGALPHARPTIKKIKEHELVTLDFGCVHKGYCSDMTRTVAIGIPSARARGVYRLVLEAQRRAIDAAHAGMEARSLDVVARKFLFKAGYGKFFGHGLGHGIGIEIHAFPKISPISTHILAEGNVITIEPGIYLPGRLGVRIEDDVVIHKSNCEVITNSPKELIVL